MNYRHSYHAGNFADVVKHVALVAILLHLKKKDSPFAVIDTHAGRGFYDLAGEEARRTGEANDGIEKLRGLKAATPALAVYLEEVRALGAGGYPGSPLLTAKLMRPSDRLVALERHPEEAAVLARTLSPWRKASAELADGYVRLPKLLPPAERRGLVVIDPPFEQTDEFEKVAALVAAALRRFANGIYLVWFPIKSDSAANSFCSELAASGAGKAVRIDIERGAAPQEGGLFKAGIAVLNPPYGFAREMQAALAEITPHLGPEASADIRWIAGSEES